MRYGVFENTNGETSFIDAYNTEKEAEQAARKYTDYAREHYRTVTVNYEVNPLYD